MSRNFWRTILYVCMESFFVPHNLFQCLRFPLKIYLSYAFGKQNNEDATLIRVTIKVKLGREIPMVSPLLSDFILFWCHCKSEPRISTSLLPSLFKFFIIIENALPGVKEDKDILLDLEMVSHGRQHPSEPSVKV